VLVASPAYLAKAGRPRHPDELSDHRTIGVTALGDPRNWRFGTGPGTVRRTLNPAYVTNSADAAIWHACHDGGLTFALSYEVADLIREGVLELVMVDFEPEAMPISFVYPSSRLLTRRVRAFMELCVQEADWDFTRLPNRAPG
jgi:DNA-binding transcriptional LysR family regulator